MWMKRSFYLCLVMLVYSSSLSAQVKLDTLKFSPSLSRLSILGDSLLKSTSDDVRLNSHALFSNLFDSILHSAEGAALSFYQVPALSVLKSDDNKIRVFNWMLITQQQNTSSFFGYIEASDLKKKSRKIYHLNESKNANNTEVELMRLDTAHWLGCVYYKLIHKSYRKADYYILLGWAPQSTLTTRKVIEPLVISSTKISFGSPILKTGGKPKMRMIFEYNSQSAMTLRYDESNDRILFDNLSPSDPSPEAKSNYSLYGPDFSYNELKFEKGSWKMTKDVDIKNQGANEGKKGDLKKMRTNNTKQ
jgi:hypothetical protein